MRVYIAGPEVFLPNFQKVFREKGEICQKYDIEAIFPFDGELSDEQIKTNPRLGAGIIYKNNIELINKCQGLIANITPFRGVHMDPGTSFEIGYAIGMKMEISCYTQDGRDLLSRAGDGNKTCTRCLKPVDRDGYLIENFGMSENLMIKAALNEQGRRVVRVDVDKAGRFYSADGFEGAVLELLKKSKP